MRASGKRSLHHCSFRSEKNQRTEDKPITFMKKVCCQLSPFLSCHSRTERPVHEHSSLSSSSRENPRRDSENERIRILFERQKEQILAEVKSARQAFCLSEFIRSRLPTPTFSQIQCCLGGFKQNPNEVWKKKIKWYFAKKL